MNIEMKVVKTITFRMVEPAKCFIPEQSLPVPDNRNLWMRLNSHCLSAVNLFSGELAAFNADVVCRPVIAKVVVE